MVRVTAIVLTYNRCALLGRCLDAIAAQTRPCDRIVVVDNGSTDGTADFLRARASETLEVHTLPRNVGAAGGFHAGMRRGHETGADFVWVMDDDVIAAPDALAALLGAYDMLESAGAEPPFVISAAHSPQGLITNTPDIDKRRNALSYEDWPRLLAQGLMPVNRATFVSILLARRTIDRYGLPIEAMFIWGEDGEYTLRITRDAPGYLVGHSHVEHVRAMSGALDIRTEHDARRIAWHKFQVRNNIYIRRRYGGKAAALRHALWVIWEAVRLARGGHLRKARTVVAGVLLGLTFSPEV